MRTSSNISFWANGPLKAFIYKNGKALALEIGDQNGADMPSDRVGIFVDQQYAKQLSIAVLAFNEAWKTVTEEMEKEHE